MSGRGQRCDVAATEVGCAVAAVRVGWVVGAGVGQVTAVWGCAVAAARVGWSAQVLGR